ncbi:MAG TPA: hypothetical protein VGL86_17220 [Polyangia bacterium]|jgi:hypothetical protein
MKQMLALGLVAATAACDPLATGGFKPPYETINGQIDGTTAMEMPADVHVAILWENDVSPTSNYSLDAIDVVAQFPAAFHVPIIHLPAMQVIDTIPSDLQIPGLDPKLSWSVGTLVVFADNDGDGQLTITAPGAPASPDRVLAADLDIWWLGSGAPAPAQFLDIFPTAPGFSLVQPAPTRDPLPGECGSFDANGHFSDLCGPVPTGDPVLLDVASFTEHMTLADNERFDGFTCSSYWGPLEYPDWDRATQDQICDGGVCPFCRGYQCPPDLPMAGDTVTCSADGLAYVYKRCTNDPVFCGTRFCHFGHGERQAADPTPTGWPCP